MNRHLRIAASLYLLTVALIGTAAFLKIGFYESIVKDLPRLFGDLHSYDDSFQLRCMAAPLVGLPCALLPLVLWFIPKIGKTLWFVVATLLASWAIFQVHAMAWHGHPAIIAIDPRIMSWGLFAYATETLWQLAYMMNRGDGGLRKRNRRPAPIVTPASAATPALVPSPA